MTKPSPPASLTKNVSLIFTFLQPRNKYFKTPRSRLRMDSLEVAEEIIDQFDDETSGKGAKEFIAD